MQRSTKYALEVSTRDTKEQPTGCFKLGHRHMANRKQNQTKNLTFLHHLVNLSNSTLAKEVMAAQSNYNFPGLVKDLK